MTFLEVFIIHCFSGFSVETLTKPEILFGETLGILSWAKGPIVPE